jgi:hypothetical protein
MNRSTTLQIKLIFHNGQTVLSLDLAAKQTYYRLKFQSEPEYTDHKEAYDEYRGH